MKLLFEIILTVPIFFYVLQRSIKIDLLCRRQPIEFDSNLKGKKLEILCTFL
jgi:hypothetical protein